MSEHDKSKVVPLTPAPSTVRRASNAAAALPTPGLHSQAIHGLSAQFPGNLTPSMRALLEKMSGLEASDLGNIDFTGCWYSQEPISVLRPSLTLAVDDSGRRWLAETSGSEGLPGPVWCVLPEPAVALLVSADLQQFIDTLNEKTNSGGVARWVRRLELKAHAVWSRWQRLAEESYRACQADPSVRAWLATLPANARIFDVRKNPAAAGWPYGLAGSDGKFFRCGSLPVFAVASAPFVNRWKQHLSQVAARGDIRLPAAAIHRRALCRSMQPARPGELQS